MKNRGNKNSWKYGHNYTKETRTRVNKIPGYEPPVEKQEEDLIYFDFAALRPGGKEIYIRDPYQSVMRNCTQATLLFHMKVTTNGLVTNFSATGMPIHKLMTLLRIKDFVSQDEFDNLTIALSFIGEVTTERATEIYKRGKVDCFKLTFQYFQTSDTMDTDIKHAATLSRSTKLKELAARWDSLHDQQR